MIKSMVEWLLSKLFPVGGVQIITPPADKFVPSAILIRVMKGGDDYKNIVKEC